MKKSKLKEKKEPITISVIDLIEGAIYKTHTQDLVQIKAINTKKNELHLYNITDACNMYTSLVHHRLVERIR